MSRWLVTRPLEDSRALAETLRTRGHSAVIAPVLEVTVHDVAPVDIEDVQAVLFTSQNGVRAFAAAVNRRDLRVFAVGRSTAGAAREAGFTQVESADGDSAMLADLAAARLDPAAGPLLHVAGAQVAGDLKGWLASRGFTVRRSVLYEARPVAELPGAAAEALRRGDVAGALFFSPRTAKVFARLVAAAGLTERLRGLAALCLSAAVADRLGEGVWGAVRVADRPDLPALLALLDPPDASPAKRQPQEHKTQQ